MKQYRFLLLLLAFLTGMATQAQFNPNNPDEPGVRPWQLTLKAIPAEAGYFNLNQQTVHTAGEQIRLTAYDHNGFSFVQWEDEQGNLLSTGHNLDYTMPSANTTLVARYEFNPTTPDEPGRPIIKKRLMLKANPEGTGSFNLSSSSDIAVGEVVNLRAYNQSQYQFSSWTESGTVVSSSAAFAYTMPNHDVTLVANFEFQPGSPNEPGQPQNEYYNIYGMRVSARTGQTIIYPIYLENRGAEVTGFQFDVMLPEGFTTDGNAMTLADRASGHSLQAVQTAEGAWRITVSGEKAIEGFDGQILALPINVPDTATVGQVFTIGITDGLIFKESGEEQNIVTRDGSLKILYSSGEITNSPDYVVTDVNTSTTVVQPGGTISLSWQVQNQGSKAGTGGWSERLYLVSPDGRKVNIGSVSYDAKELQPGAIVSRNAVITLSQLPGIDGKADVAVTIIPSTGAGETGELALNNTTQTSGQPITVGKRLVLTVPTAIQQEGEVATITCQLARSGSWTQTETYTLTKVKGDNRVTVPETVVIPREQAAAYFYLTLADDELCNADSIVRLRAEGNGYEAVEGSLTIRDNELLPLRITSSANEVTEGETFQLTVTLAQPVEQPLSVSLTAELPKRFRLPATIVIPAGQTTASIDVTATENEIPEGTVSCAFIAYAEGYEPSKAIVILNDNDLPVLELTFTPNKVKEGDGPISVTGTLRRLTNVDKKVTVRLSDDSNGGLYFSQRELTMAKGVQQATFSLGPVDNNTVDGDRQYTVTAAVWLSSCSCSASGQAAGNVQALLQVFDDDGPALSLTSSQATVREGVTTRVTVTRNTSTEQALTVRLTSDHDDLLTYNHTVVIPAGQKSAYAEVTPAANDTQNDSQVIVFTAEAEGFSSGTCYLLVTDQTLPDAMITGLSFQKEEAEALSDIQVTINVKNAGAAGLPALTKVNLYIYGQKNPIATLYTQEEVIAGGTTTLKKMVTLPDKTGLNYFYAVVNESHEAEELLYTNNSSEFVQLNLLPRFKTTITTDKQQCVAGDKVVISGSVQGTVSANVEVEVYVSDGEVRQTIMCTSDANGNFSTTWTPLAAQAGRFSIGACYPGENISVAQATVDVLGLKLVSNRRITADVICDEPYLGSIEIANPGFVNQTIKGVDILDKPDNCYITFGEMGGIIAGERFSLPFTLTCSTPTTGSKRESIRLCVSTQEGAQLNFAIYYYCHPQNAMIVASVASIETAFAKDSSRDYLFTITNEGKGETGSITVSMPQIDWLSLSTPQQIPSLKAGESVTIGLRLNPTGELQMNVPQNGTIGVNCVNGSGIVIPYKITLVSDKEGTLIVDVIDEYISTEGHPHLQGANVVISQPVSGIIVAQGTTDANGRFVTNIPEGYYAIKVTAEKHGSYQNHLQVAPSMQNYERVFLQYQAITVNWDVVETEIEDEYDIKTWLEYETYVPIPVVEVIFPDSLEYKNQVFNLVLTNKGLITAINIDYQFPAVEGVTFEVLNPITELAPQTSMVVSVKMTVNRKFWWGHPISNEDIGGEYPPQPLPPGYEPNQLCIQLCMRVKYDYVCKDDLGIKHLGTIDITYCWWEGNCPFGKQSGTTIDNSSNDDDNDNGGSTGGSGGGGGRGSTTSVYRDTHCHDTEKDACKRGKLEWFEKWGRCTLGFGDIESGVLTTADMIANNDKFSRFTCLYSMLRTCSKEPVNGRNKIHSFSCLTSANCFIPVKSLLTAAAKYLLKGSNCGVQLLEEMERCGSCKAGKMLDYLECSLPEYLDLNCIPNAIEEAKQVKTRKDLLDVTINMASCVPLPLNVIIDAKRQYNCGIEFINNPCPNDSNTANERTPKDEDIRGLIESMSTSNNLLTSILTEFCKDGMESMPATVWQAIQEYIAKHSYDNGIVDIEDYLLSNTFGITVDIDAIKKFLERYNSTINGNTEDAFDTGIIQQNYQGLIDAQSYAVAKGYSNFLDMYKGESQRITNEIKEEIIDNLPAYIAEMIQIGHRFLEAEDALGGIIQEIYGDKVWMETSLDELLEYMSLLETFMDGEGQINGLPESIVKHKPDVVTEEHLLRLIERINNSNKEASGQSISSQNRIDESLIDSSIDIINTHNEYAQKQGYEDIIDMCVDKYKKAVDIARDEDGSANVCANITLEIPQKLCFTRQAFRGTLTIFNGHEETAMTDVRLDLEVKDENGNIATSHEFKITAESLVGFDGETGLDDGWTLEAQQTGTATILFIPSKSAAPTEPKKYSFGGSLSYIDPFRGLEVTRHLLPVTLTVNPSPDLELTYLMQRDVYGDDPLTEDVVEPMEEAEFALIINNKGYGEAKNVRMVTEQPKIIDNEKGLFVNFDIASSQVNGDSATLSLSQTILNDFGTIAARSQAYAQWWLRSTLLGHFTSYEVEATHITNYGNADLSLVDTVTIHEMTHGFTPMVRSALPLGSSKNGQSSIANVKRGWLVNDIVDADDMPDVVYFSDATQQTLNMSTGAISKNSKTEYELTVKPRIQGWNYGSVTDPTNGKQKLTKVVRKSDGIEMPVDNIWQTYRTLHDGSDWSYENRLHFVGDIPADGEAFILTFEPKPEVELAVESYAGVPKEGTVLKEQLTTVTVKFNKPIKAETFTTEDITINCQGDKQDVSLIVIEKQSEQEYKLILNEVTLGDGYYVLTVQTAGIEDNEGFNGSTGKQATWVQFADGKVSLQLIVSPASAGTVSPASGRYDYDSEVTLTATPADGYTFSCWKLGEQVLSSDHVTTCHLVSNTVLTAQFTINHYATNVDYDASIGMVEGYGTGIYDYGTKLRLVAVPAKDYLFHYWMVNGEKVTGDTLTLTVTGPLNIKAEFIRDIYEQTFTLAKGWNWISTYLGEPLDVTALLTYANRIVGQFDELIKDAQFGFVGGLQELSPGVGYKVEMAERFSTSYRGHLLKTPVPLRKGWNWVAYPWTEPRLVSTTITDAEEGDYLVSQRGFTEYADGYWEGSLRTLIPGEGCLYKSASDKTLGYDFTVDGSQFTVHNAQFTGQSSQFTASVIEVNRYPNTMNVTARIYLNGTELTGDGYQLYAMNGDELRGIGEYIGSNYYMTVYGDLPVDISFLVEDIGTGETFLANEHLKFFDGVLGSRKQPFAITIGETTGIVEIENGKLKIKNSVYDLQGRRMESSIFNSQSSIFNSQSSILRKGVYIVNGHKVVNGKYIK